MQFIADFHIHSRYSRATSKDMNLENLDYWASIKGIKVIGTGDFTHPFWFKEIKEKLEEIEPGLYKLKSKFRLEKAKSFSETRFILTVEISSIYSKNGKVRRIHNLIFAPSIEIAEKINNQLGLRGNLRSDGRPILGLDSKELLKIILNISKDCVLIPAHAWTPWFSIFGSMSGFNSIEECFEELSPYIFSIETGLSSDPPMNWQLSALDKITLISNSDSHSLQKIGREANVFNTELSYFKIIEAIKNKDKEKFLYTIEFFPEEGKYHFDGHRLCGISFSPRETKENKGICPKCKKPLTIGVLSRVKELADRKEGFLPNNRIPYKNLIPLNEIIADVVGTRVFSQKVLKEYNNLINNFGNEFNILLNISINDLKKVTLPEIAEGIIRVREGKVKLIPGYDGEYGKIKIFDKENKNNGKEENISYQKSLF